MEYKRERRNLFEWILDIELFIGSDKKLLQLIVCRRYRRIIYMGLGLNFDDGFICVSVCFAALTMYAYRIYSNRFFC